MRLLVAAILVLASTSASAQVAPDARAYVMTLVGGDGASAPQWASVLDRVEPQLWAAGFGQARDSSGHLRGSVFLPTAICPNAAPRTEAEQRFSVSQDPACWAHRVDIVDGAGLTWVWIDRGGPAYQPLTTSAPPPPAPGVDMTPRVETLEAAVRALTARLDALEPAQASSAIAIDTLAHAVDELHARPIPTMCTAAINLGVKIPISCRLQ